MVKGIGTDIIEIERIQQAVEKTNGFLEKIFSEVERESFSTKKLRMESLAGAFAAKEAMSKALGTGFRGFGPSDVEVLRDDLGKPYIRLNQGAKDLAEQLGIDQIFVSISHCKNYATATVVVEGSERIEHRN